MNIHEYQAKHLLEKYGALMPQGGVAYTPVEAQQVARGLGGKAWMVKAQIHAGGRGKGTFKGHEGEGGGVRAAHSIEDVGVLADCMLGKSLITKQTGPEGKTVRRVYVEEACEIARECYVGLMINCATGRINILASSEGGVEFEDMAPADPDSMIVVSIDPAEGYRSYHGRRIAYGLKLSNEKQVASLMRMIDSLYKAFVALDCSLIEINPLAITPTDLAIILDCKIAFDDNALYRHKDIETLRDETEEDPIEIEAVRHNVSYVRMDGQIGCIVNGAGLAMATMDIIKLYGGEPANFLDVGGGATKERVATACKLILSDPNVEGVLVNIFGGIMRCDIIAEGVAQAMKDASVSLPLVVRLEGTNVDLGKKILMESGLSIIFADGLVDAAEKIVKAVKEAA